MQITGLKVASFMAVLALFVQGQTDSSSRVSQGKMI
jgi:hypothetical protein